MFRFQKLDVWQKASNLASRIDQLTRAFPDNERFGLTSPMRRAAVSIAANIAEGSGRSSDVVFARFLEMAYGSLTEVLSHSSIACDQGFLPSGQREELFSSAEELARMMSGLRARLLNPPESPA